MAFDPNDPNDVKLVEDKVNEAVTGLAKKNQELLGEQRKLKDQLSEINQKFEGLDAEQMRKLMLRFENDEDAKLISEGKTDELINRRTERMRQDFEKKIGTQEKEILNLREFAQRFKDGLLGSAIRDAAMKSGCIPEAADDFVLRGRQIFQVDDEGNLIAKKGDDVTFGKDGKTPLQPGEWVESLRENAPHLWPKASGTNANGSSGGGASKKFSEMSEADRVALHRKDPDKYRALRDAEKANSKSAYS